MPEGENRIGIEQKKHVKGTTKTGGRCYSGPRFEKNTRTLHGALSGKHNPYGFEKNMDVLLQGPVFDVFPVQTDHRVKITDLAAAADLPEAGDSRPCRHSGAVEGFVAIPFVHRRRTGADQRHVSLQDIEKLGELIQRQVADPSADAFFPGSVRALRLPNNARVMFQFKHEMVFLPGAPSVSPKEMAKWAKKFMKMANEHMVEQAETGADFAIKGQKQVREMVSTAMDKVEKSIDEMEKQAKKKEIVVEEAKAAEPVEEVKAEEPVEEVKAEASVQKAKKKAKEPVQAEAAEVKKPRQTKQKKAPAKEAKAEEPVKAEATEANN